MKSKRFGAVVSRDKRPDDPSKIAVEGPGFVAHRVGQHLIDDAHRVEQVHGRVDHQHLLEVEDLPLIIQARQKSRLGAPQAVAGEIKRGDIHPVGHLPIGLLHHPVDIFRVMDDVAGHLGGGGVDDEVHVGGRGDRDDAETGLVKYFLQRLHLGGFVTGPGAGDHEDQRRPLLLGYQRKPQTLAIPEEVRDLTVREDLQAVVLHRHFLGKVGPINRRGPDDRCRIGVDEGVVVGPGGGGSVQHPGREEQQPQDRQSQPLH